MENSPCVWTGIIQIWAWYPEVIYRFKKTPIEIPLPFWTEIEKKNPKIHMQPHKTPNNKNYFEQEEQSWRHHTFWF